MRIEQFRMERMQSTHENYVEFNLSESGVHPIRTRDLVDGEGAADRLLDLELGYPQSNGTEELRDRIARFYPGATRENVLVTNGGAEANYATFWSILEKGDRVACMLPNYLQTWGLSRAYAAAADPYRMVLVAPGNGGPARWALDVEGLRRAVTRKTRLILVTNPNNPTGGILTEAEMDAIVSAARSVGAWIVADEIYRGAEVSGVTTPTFWGRYDRVLITSGLSKAFGLPGLRIGWIVGPPRTVARIWSYRDYTTICLGMLSVHLATSVMDPPRREAIFGRTRSIIRANLSVVEEWVRSRPGTLSACPPLAGAIVLVRYDLPLASLRLTETLRTEQSVLIVPGDYLGIPKHIRVGFGSDADYLRQGLARIDRALDAIGDRSRAQRPRASRASASISRRASARA